LSAPYRSAQKRDICKTNRKRMSKLKSEILNMTTVLEPPAGYVFIGELFKTLSAMALLSNPLIMIVHIITKIAFCSSVIISITQYDLQFY
jgi:hypothetical protein